MCICTWRVFLQLAGLVSAVSPGPFTAARAQQWSAKPWKSLCASLEHFQFLVCYTSSTLEKSLCCLPPTVLGHETSMAVFQRFGGCFSFL